ncbi:DUF3160 domain-containing protein [bacterium]|nr:DUF3160 domain-containing protein [bacterium]
MASRRSLVMSVLLAASSALAGAVQEGAWRQAAAKAGLSGQDVQRLGRDRVLMTNETFKQVFSAYVDTQMPVFITSDSLLNAFHVLYEESALRMEETNAELLPEVLGFLWKNLAGLEIAVTGEPKLAPAARLRAQVVLGTALALLGKPPESDANAAPLIEAEVKRIHTATIVEKPAWLGPPDPGFQALDYSRFKPRGFYTRSETLQRHFRAVSWLQAIPFRVTKDDELLAILMLGNCMVSSRFRDGDARAERYKTLFRCHTQFIGAGDDSDLLVATDAAGRVGTAALDEAWLTGRRKWLLKRAKNPLIHDQIRAPGATAPDETVEVSLRILAAHRTPDAILFQRTTEVRKSLQAFPMGLEVAALLGSPFARNRLPAKDRDKLLAAIDKCRPLLQEDDEDRSLYLLYLDCIAELLNAPEPDAPAFMKGEAWLAKSCQTALAGWAQLKHTWALHAKQSGIVASLTELPVGLVEPDPEFFAKMATLVARTEGLLKRAGAIDRDTRSIGKRLTRALAIIEKANVARASIDDVSSQLEHGRDMSTIMMLTNVMGPQKKGEGTGAFLHRCLPRLKAIAASLERGVAPEDKRARQIVDSMCIQIAPRWRELHTLCRTFERMARKQVRGLPFTHEEERVLELYAHRLGSIMLYGGTAWEIPRDDAARIADVFFNPNVKKRYLEVGIARPRALWVLYPWKGRDVLCRGAVLPYYEFTSPQRLTNAEWKAMLDSPKRPASPDWLKPLLGLEGIDTPQFPKRR